jgi:hypothetical protein
MRNVVSDFSIMKMALNVVTGNFAPPPRIDPGAAPVSDAVQITSEAAAAEPTVLEPRRDVFKAARTTMLSEADLGVLGIQPPVVVAAPSTPRSIDDLDSVIGIGPAGKGKGHAHGRFKHYDKLDDHGKKAYDDLEVSGVLVKPNSAGVSVLSLIDSTADAVLGAWMKGLQAVDVINELLVNLANPAGIFQGDDTDSCTASAVQQLLAASDPVEYVRIGLDLSISGSSTCKGGQKLGIDDSSFGGTEGRSALSDAYQGSFMALGRSLPAGEGEDSVGLLFRSSTRTTYAGENSLQGSVGLTGAQFNGLIDALTGRDYVTVEVTPDNRADAILELQKALRQGPVPVVLNPPDGSTVGHAVMVTGIRNGMVDLWDPGLGQNTSMTLEDFQARVGALNLPPSPVAEVQKLRDRVVPMDRYRKLDELQAALKARSLAG